MSVPEFDCDKKPCRGKHSIQAEITRLLKANGRRWNQIADRKTREAVRQKLLATGKQWCDATTGDCACYTNKLNL